MELKQLQSFIAVVECQSFTKAAQRLFLSQPSVSAHIRRLEEELHSRLLIRTTKNVEITPRGWELYECACEMIKRWDNLLQRWDNETRRVIRLGASTIPSAYILPELLPAYGKEHPDIYFSIYQSNSQDITDRLLQGDFDVGFIGMDSSSEYLACVPFYQDRMVMITPVRGDYLELKKQSSPLQELLRSPMILREKQSGSQKSADRFLESLGIRQEELKVVARINDQEAVKNLVAQGLGVSILSERAARNFVDEKRVLLFELPEQTARRSLYLIYPKNYILNPYLQKFMEYVMRFYQG